MFANVHGRQLLHSFLDLKFGADGAAAAGELAKETCILAQLRHPNIVKFLGLAFYCDPATNRNGAMIVTEWCAENLEGWLGTWRFGAELLEIGVGIASGMKYLHAQGIIHRDLKPDSVLMDESRQTLKLSGFNMARTLLSRTQGCVTAWYRPPEIILGDSYYGPAVEMWSAGCILAEMLLTHRPDLLGPSGPEDIVPLPSESLGPQRPRDRAGGWTERLREGDLECDAPEPADTEARGPSANWPGPGVPDAMAACAKRPTGRPDRSPGRTTPGQSGPVPGLRPDSDCARALARCRSPLRYRFWGQSAGKVY